MKSQTLFLIFTLVLWLAVSHNAEAQISVHVDSTLLVQVDTKDGNTYIGYIVGNMDGITQLNTQNLGLISIPANTIVGIKRVKKEQLVNGEYWFENPHDTRYFFQANAYNLRKGEGYYQNTWVLLNQISYGVTNQFSLGVGAIPLFLFGASESTPIWLTPKVSFPIKKDKLNIAVGGLLGTIGFQNGAQYGILFGTFTYGPRDKNLSFSAGYGYAGSSWAQTPTMGLSGLWRIKKNFALVSENYLLDTGDSNLLLTSAGIRFMGKKIAVDGALFSPFADGLYDYGGLHLLPWLSVTWAFGSPK